MKKILILGLVCGMSLVLSGCVSKIPTKEKTDKADLDAIKSGKQISRLGFTREDIIDEINKEENNNVGIIIMNPDSFYDFRVGKGNMEEFLQQLKYIYDKEVIYDENGNVKTIKYTANIKE